MKILKRIKKERKAAEDMRLKTMKSLAESKARKRESLSDDDESPKNSKKRRSSVSDSLQYLREKAENDRKLKRQELNFRDRKWQCVIHSFNVHNNSHSK